MMKNVEDNIRFFAGDRSKAFNDALMKLRADSIVERIWSEDYTVWSNSSGEITNRLGWLHSPQHSLKALDIINGFVDLVIKEGFTQALLLGMGGSSLAPRVFRKVFGVKSGFLDMDVLDSTHPEAVLECSRNFNPAKTLYIVSTKSGGTVETLSFMKYFFNQAATKLGREKAARHFVAITGPGSGLEKTAKENNFRRIFLNDPDIGGRYSALSYFGIIPAALIGVDIKEILERARGMQQDTGSSNSMNYAANLGVFIGKLAQMGRDKLTFILSMEISHFGVWIEQLIAESTGKSGKGILPVVDESMVPPEYYSGDRLFVYIKTKHDSELYKKTEELKAAGHPIVEITLKDTYDLGGEFFRWEMATAIAGHEIGIHPFNQPNVESSKVLARKMLKEYSEKGKLSEEQPSLEESGMKIYADSRWDNIKDSLNEFLDNYSHGDLNGRGRSYVSIQAYLKPDENTTELLREFRTRIQKKNKVATTLAYGPGFLHSTGQLHKGDAGHGLFIQFTADSTENVWIPDDMTETKSSVSFGTLIKAQALGDKRALLDSGRRIITIDLGNNISEGLRMLSNCIE